MSANTKKIEKALAEKGLTATVTWTPPSGENADSGITGFYSEEVATTKFLVKGDPRPQYLPNSLGYSVEDAVNFIGTIERFIL